MLIEILRHRSNDPANHRAGPACGPPRAMQARNQGHRPIISSAVSAVPVYVFVVPILVLVLFILATSTIKILREYERAVVFTLGRFQRVKGPGLVLLFPFAQEMVRVDLRIQVVEIPTQDVISRDNVSMKVDAVLYFNVVNPEHAII